ncbi:MAG: tail fiber domain-containing protein, partial [Elusimicrobia bacterium]|nr:tail fiber domain-containing protein [Elusimicrobiota bacterium]
IVTDDLIVNGDDITGSAGTTLTFSTIGDTVTVSGDIRLGAATGMVYKTNGDKALQFETSNSHLYTKDDGWFTLRRTSDDAERFKIDSNGYMHLVGNIIKDSGSNDQITFTAGSLATFGYDIKVTGNDIQDSGGNERVTLGDTTVIRSSVTVGGDVEAGTFTVVNGGKLYLNGTDQYIFAAGGSDLAFVDNSSNWMRFATNGSEFHWFADGPAMSDSKMILQADGDLEIDGDMRVDGNEIMNSDGEATITMDADQNVRVDKSFRLATQGLDAVQTYGRTLGVGLIQQYHNSTEDFKRYLDIVSAGNDRSSIIRFLNQTANDTDPEETMRIDKTGYVGVGATDPQTKFQVDGGSISVTSMPTLTVAGTALYYDGDGILGATGSSIRYKKNIKDLDVKAEDVLKLRPVRFNWKASGEEDVGLIAEEVDETIKDLVVYDKEGRSNGVKYEKVAVYLISAIKEQQKEIDELKRKIAELKK